MWLGLECKLGNSYCPAKTWWRWACLYVASQRHCTSRCWLHLIVFHLIFCCNISNFVRWQCWYLIINLRVNVFVCLCLCAVKIGRPGYRVTKQFDPETKQRSLLFQIEYPEIEDNTKPRHRFMSSYEQVISILFFLNSLFSIDLLPSAHVKWQKNLFGWHYLWITTQPLLKNLTLSLILSVTAIIKWRNQKCYL
jgi:hypothetical protein